MNLRRRLSLIASLYAISLPLTAIELEPIGPNLPGWLCLVCVPAVCLYPAWWGNPLLLIGCALLAQGYRSVPRACGWVALVLAATFVPQIASMSVLDGPSQDFAPEFAVGFRHSLGVLKLGYWFWLASMAALIIVGGGRRLPDPLSEEGQEGL